MHFSMCPWLTSPKIDDGLFYFTFKKSYNKVFEKKLKIHAKGSTFLSCHGIMP